MVNKLLKEAGLELKTARTTRDLGIEFTAGKARTRTSAKVRVGKAYMKCKKLRSRARQEAQQ